MRPGQVTQKDDVVGHGQQTKEDLRGESTITGLLMQWFFVRSLSLSLMETVSSKELCRMVSSGNNDDSRRCDMDLLPFSEVYNVSRLNDLSSSLRKYAVSQLGSENMLAYEQKCIWDVCMSKEKSRRGTRFAWLVERFEKTEESQSLYIKGSLLLDGKVGAAMLLLESTTCRRHCAMAN